MTVGNRTRDFETRAHWLKDLSK